MASLTIRTAAWLKSSRAFFPGFCGGRWDDFFSSLSAARSALSAFVRLFAMPTVSHRPEPIASLWEFKLRHYQRHLIVDEIRRFYSWVGPSSRPETIASEPWVGMALLQLERNGALFYKCMLQCARKLLDTADIVREAMLRQQPLVSGLPTIRERLRALLFRFSITATPRRIRRRSPGAAAP